MLLLVRWITRCADTFRRYEVGWGVLHWLRAPDDVTVQEPIVRHAETDRSAFEEFFHAAAITFQEVPLLRLASVLASVLSRIVSTVARAERKYVDRAGREHCKVEVVRVHPLIQLTEIYLECWQEHHQNQLLIMNSN